MEHLGDEEKKCGVLRLTRSRNLKEGYVVLFELHSSAKAKLDGYIPQTTGPLRAAY